MEPSSTPFYDEAGVTRTLLTGVRFANNLRREQEAFKKSIGKPTVGPEQVYNTGLSPYKHVRRGILAYKDSPDKMYLFQFNPEEIADTKENDYSNIKRPNRQFVNDVWAAGGPRTIAFKLDLDATAGSNTPEFTSTPLGNKGFETLDDIYPNGVLDDVQFLQSFLYPTLPEEDAPRFLYGGAVPAEQFSAPPTAIFVYGQMYFEGLVKTANPVFNLWDEKLRPRRATMEIVFQVFEEQTVTPIQSLIRKHTRQ